MLEGKRVLAPAKDIQEVRNAINAYESMPRWKSGRVADLLEAHRLLTFGLVDNPGHFRRGNVGIYRETQLIHMAPPASRVAHLIPSFTLSDNVSEKMSEQILSFSEAERAVLSLLNRRPALSAKALASELAVSARTVERYLQSLQQKGKLLRVGAKKGGHWQVT